MRLTRTGAVVLTLLFPASVATPAAASPTATVSTTAVNKANHAPLPPTALTVGDRTTPLGVEGAPLFGWQVRDPDPGEYQTAYQIKVFSKNQVWDSGRQPSAQTASVPYTGPALTSGASYRWAVRTFDRHGKASGWAQSTFDTALASADWQARWIRRTTAEKDDYTLARKEFTVGAGRVVRARLYLSASQQYQAFVNGKLVDRGPAFAYPGEGYYQVTDITNDVSTGQAAIGVLAHWYGPGQGRPAGEPGILARLVIDHGDGSRQVITSDGTWKVARGPWLSAPYRNGDGRDYIENVDGRLIAQQAGWTSPGFDDSAWQTAQVFAGPAVQAQQTRLSVSVAQPVSVTALPSGAVVADFGKVIPALPRVRFRDGVAGKQISMVAGYLLNADGSVSNTAQDNQSTDLSYGYTQRDGDQTFEAFTYEGFRYLQVEEPADIAAVVQHTDANPARQATFTSSDATLDAVFTLMQRSALYSAQEQFLDTPTREKGQFLADSVNISRALMAGSGDRAMSAKAIREFIASQARYWPDGRLNAVYPNGDGKRDIPDFTELFPGWTWDHYVASGDRVLLSQAYPVSTAIADYVRRYRDPATGLVTNLEGGSGAYQYGIIDWPDRFGYDTSTSARTTVNILAVDVLRSTAREAQALGRPQAEVDALTADADALVAAINARLRLADGRYIDGLTSTGTQSTHASQIANAYAIAYDVAPRDTYRVLGDHLAGLGMQLGPMTADTLITALHRAGRDDQVLARFTDSTSLGWANILARGGTFTWESWTAPERGESMSHGWGAAALTGLQQAMLGVTITAPAGRTVTIAPPSGTALTHAEGSMWTQAGTLKVGWREVRGGTAITVTVPDNVTVEVHVPVTGSAKPVAIGGGGPRFEGFRDGAAVYTVGSGTSVFTPR